MDEEELGAEPDGAPFGVVPTPDDGPRLSDSEPWGDSTRPRGPSPDPERKYGPGQPISSKNQLQADGDGIFPLVVYGVDISFFTGKLEAYLRYRGIPYEHRNLGVVQYLWTVPRALGATQFPSVRLADGRWMSDTSPMIRWLERGQPGPGVIPQDPVTRFLALLIEDYGDEWLWRPAMHYRWNNPVDAALASKRLAETVVVLPAPLEMRRRWVGWRQARKFVRGDGVVDGQTREHMDSAYLRLLDRIQPALAERPFLLGARPTVADFGLYGSMFRHFSNDPTPAAIMRERAPAAWDWVKRIWEARAAELGEAGAVMDFPFDLRSLLGEVVETLLPQLDANARAHGDGLSQHDLVVQGVTFRGVPTSPYRVWVLEQMRQRWQELDGGEREDVLGHLGVSEAPTVFSQPSTLASGHDPGGEAPFCKVSRMVRD